MLISLSAKADDPKTVDWYKFKGKRSSEIIPSSTVKLEPDGAYGLRMLRNKREYYLVLIEKPSQKFKIDKTKAAALLKKSEPVTYKQAEKLKSSAPTDRKGIGGRKAKITTFDSPRFRTGKTISAREEKSKGIDPKNYQWRVYKQTKPLNYSEKRKRQIEILKGDIIGVRFMRESQGGVMITPEGFYRALDTKHYDHIVAQTDVLPKNKWLTQKIDAETIKLANKTETELAFEEAARRKEQARQARLERERRAAQQRQAEREAEEKSKADLEELLATREEREAERKQKEMQARKDATVDPSAYIRDRVSKELPDDVLEALDMDDLDEIDLELEDIGADLLELDEEFEPEEEATKSVLNGLNEMLESQKQEEAEKLAGELDTGEDSEDETEEDSEDETEEDETEEDSEDETEEDDIENLDDDDIENLDEEDEDSEAGDEEADSEDGTEDLGDEDADSEDEDLDAEEDAEDPEEESEEDADVNKLRQELDALGDDDDEVESDEPDVFDDEEETSDDEMEEDDDAADFDLSDDDDADYSLDDDDDAFDDELDSLDGDSDESDEDEGDGFEDDDDSDEDSTEDADAALDIGDVSDDDVDSAEAELDELDKVSNEVTEEDEDSSARAPEEADVITFNDDDENRKFLVIDSSPSERSENIIILKVYDITNEPDEYREVRYNRTREKTFLETFEIVDRVNGKLFNRYADEVEDLEYNKKSILG